jgi:RNA polymerase sigma factor (sigma-70 family)
MHLTVVADSLDSDASLVEAARRGDHAAFGVLVSRHRLVVMRLCRQVVHEPAIAEDAVQEAVLQAWLSLDRLRHTDRFGAWLAGIALHICYRWSRYRADQTWSLEALLGGRTISEPIDSHVSLPETVELRELGQRVRRAIAELPPGQRNAVALFYLGDLSHAEIGALLGIGAGAVKTRLHKARGRLRRTLLGLWREEHMTTGTDFIDVNVEDVQAISVDEPPGERRVVLLVEREGVQVLPIWVGGFEGDSIAIGLLCAETRRPLTYVLTAQLLQAAGGQLREVRIERLVDETFYAQVLVHTSNGERVIDARPSDAIALALQVGAPIRVNSHVMQQAGVTRAQLAQKAAASRSARAQADQIRERLSEPRASWAVSTLF